MTTQEFDQKVAIYVEAIDNAGVMDTPKLVEELADVMYNNGYVDAKDGKPSATV